jgi:hypothetical protein
MLFIEAGADAAAIDAMLRHAVAGAAPRRRRLRRFGKVLGHGNRDSIGGLPRPPGFHGLKFRRFLFRILFFR